AWLPDRAGGMTAARAPPALRRVAAPRALRARRNGARVLVAKDRGASTGAGPRQRRSPALLLSHLPHALRPSRARRVAALESVSALRAARARRAGGRALL